MLENWQPRVKDAHLCPKEKSLYMSSVLVSMVKGWLLLCVVCGELLSLLMQ